MPSSNGSDPKPAHQSRPIARADLPEPATDDLRADVRHPCGL